MFTANEIAAAKAAKAAYMREWRAKNKEHVKEYRKNWRKNNPEKVEYANEQTKKWIKENPEKAREHQIRYWSKKAAALEEKE